MNESNRFFRIFSESGLILFIRSIVAIWSVISFQKPSQHASVIFHVSLFIVQADLYNVVDFICPWLLTQMCSSLCMV